MKKRILATMLLLAMILSVLPEKSTEAKTKMYLIESLSGKQVKFYNYSWTGIEGYKPKGKLKKMKVTGTTKYYELDPETELSQAYPPVKVTLAKMKKNVKWYLDNEMHMLATIKYKTVSGKRRVVSITEELQDW